MRVFISWSGERSRLIAESLRDWIPYVLPAAEPWMSATDIDRGARWSTEVSAQLDAANVGIICLTPENLDAPWILFEAGALSKILSKSLVCTYLYQLRPTDIKGPLAQFQAAAANKLETRKLLASMNKALGSNALPDVRLERMFDTWWPQQDSILKSLTQRKEETAPLHRPDRELLEEILQLQRKMDTRLFVPEMKATGWLKGTNVDAPRRRRQNETAEGSAFIVDTRPLLGSAGSELSIPYPVFGTVSDFLDQLFLDLQGAVAANTYGAHWALRESKSGLILKDMGRTWARKHLKKLSDDRSLEAVGIGPGKVFEAIRLE